VEAWFIQGKELMKTLRDGKDPLDCGVDKQFSRENHFGKQNIYQ